MLGASAKGMLEFPAKVLAIGMPEQKLGKRPGVRRDVKNFVGANPSVRTRRDVAHRVSAGLSRGDSRGRQAAHHAGCVLDVHVVQLEVLPRGHVYDAVRVFLGELRKGFQLLRIHSAGGNLDALHPGRVPHGVGAFSQSRGGVGNLLNGLAVVSLAVIVPLAVDSAAKARLREHALLEFALLAQGDFRLEDIDFALQGFRHFAGQLFRPL